jgi:hypothetical protein
VPVVVVVVVVVAVVVIEVAVYNVVPLAVDVDNVIAGPHDDVDAGAVCVFNLVDADGRVGDEDGVIAGGDTDGPVGLLIAAVVVDGVDKAVNVHVTRVGDDGAVLGPKVGVYCQHWEVVGAVEEVVLPGS